VLLLDLFTDPFGYTLLEVVLAILGPVTLFFLKVWVSQLWSWVV